MLIALVRLRRSLVRFGRQEDGVAALELGLVALPFFLVLTALAEVSLMAMAQTNLDMALSDTARRIRTGQVQTEGLDAGDVRDEICESLNSIMHMECTQNLFLDVQTFENFNDVNNPVPVQDGQVDEDQLGWDPGEPGEIVLVRGYYRWHIITPFFESIFSNMGNGDRLMASTMLFRNEPFPEVVDGEEEVS